MRNHKLCFAISFKVLLLSLALAGCNFTTTKVKNPDFKIDMEEVETNLKKSVTCEHIIITGAEINTNGKNTSKLIVQVINYSNIPSDEIQIKELGKSIALQLKQELKNQNDFNVYEVFFVTKETNGALTKTNSKGTSFKSEDL